MTEQQHRGWYAAFKAKDARFDGRFFVGVRSTGIYCRPVCRAKLPKPENCAFYATAAAAEQAGFRPCLLCRPELAPGTSSADATASLVRRAARLLEESCGGGYGLEELAGRLGCTARHLRRAFTAEYNVSPVQYLQTCRLLLAKSLLTDTALPVLEVAMAAGFGSLRRMNALFQKQYRLSPTSLRKQAAGEGGIPGEITLALGYRPPYCWQKLLEFLAQRAIPGVEAVREGAYLRTVRMRAGERTAHGWLRVADCPERNALRVTVAASLLPVLPQVLARVRHLFDLCCNPEAVYEALAPMDAVRPGLRVLGTRLPGCFDGFEMAVRAVLGQQITVKAARTLAARIVQAYGAPMRTGVEGLTHAFPSPGEVIALEPIEERLGELGVIAARSRTILRIARALEGGEVSLEPSAQPEQEMARMMGMPGIGAWTARYIALRAMGYTDAFLETDAAIKKALAPRSAKEMVALAEAWRPWRSYGTMNLWNGVL